MQYYNYEMSILVDGKPIHEYHHDGNIFIEGRSGSEYTIRVRNNSYSRILAVLSVDGLSVMDGKEASDKSSGYVISPRASLDVSCFIVDENTGARFKFSSKDNSYSAQSGHGTSNVGVIAMKVFDEKPKITYRSPISHGISFPPPRPSYPPRPPFPSYPGKRPPFPSYPGKFGISHNTGGWFGNGSNNVPQGGSITASCSITSTNSEVRSLTSNDLHDMEQNKLGTEFGEWMEWNVKTVEFIRSDTALGNLIIYYDTRKNLERRGVRLISTTTPPLPDPFPANKGCQPPPGWRK